MEPVKNVILPPYQLKPVICNKHCVAADTNLLQTYGAYKSEGLLHQSGSSTLLASEKSGVSNSKVVDINSPTFKASTPV